jgi:hypothetical protein
MAEDEVHVSSSMDPDLEEALGRLAARIRSVEEHLAELSTAGKRAGDGVEAGLDKASRAADRTKRASAEAVPPVKELGDQAEKTGRKAAAGSVGLQKFAKEADKAGKKAGGVGSILAAYRWAGIATGLFALAGGLSAIAAGAAIAVGGLAPMAGVIALIPGLFVAAKLSMLLFKLSATQLEDTVTHIKNQFTELGPVIAGGGLKSGLDYFSGSIGKLAGVTGRGLAGFGAELGSAARSAGQLARSAPFLAQVQGIFVGLRPAVGNVAMALLSVARIILNVISASLPIVNELALDLRRAADSALVWSTQALASGKLTAMLTHSWEVFTRTVGVLVDLFVGVVNIFRIAGGYSTSMGKSIEDNAAAFRHWTESASGQAKINQYFADSLPALHEIGRLLGGLVGGFARLATNQDVAPLLAQISDQLGPALAHLIDSFTGANGLGPALISTLTALVNLVAALGSSTSTLTIFANVVTTIANGIVWITQNVPGASHVIGGLLSTFLAFKLLGPVFGLVSSGAKAFDWISKAAKMEGELSGVQKLLGGQILPALGKLGPMLGGPLMAGIRGVGAALSAAFVASPIGWIVLAVVGLIAVIVLLWIKCAWFRDAVMAVWRAIQAAFFAVVDALKTAWFAVLDALHATWQALVTAWQAVVNTIVAVGMWIWDHGLKQVFDVIVAVGTVVFKIIMFSAQTTLYIVMALFSLLAWLASLAFKAIAAGVTWLWQNAIQPTFNFVAWLWGVVTGAMVASWNWLVGIVSNAWNWLVGLLSAAWNWFNTNVIQPVIGAIMVGWNMLTTNVSGAWNVLTNWLSDRWSAFSSVVSAVVGAIRTAWNGLTGWLSSAFAPVGTAINAVWEGIKTAASAAADIVKGIWNGVLDILKGIWNTIARIWNGIPSVTVPDWVPGLGGTTFGLPKMPILYAGGPTPGGPALVGEHGPEPLMIGDKLSRWLGLNGPEVANLPRGGYVLPNLATLAAGMARPIPRAVANAAAKSVPAYAQAGAGSDRELARAVRQLAASADRAPMHVYGGEDTRKAVLDALEEHERRKSAKGAYDYTAGQG